MGWRSSTLVAISLGLLMLSGAGCKKEKFGISRVSPSAGPYTGEMEIEIKGTGFDTNSGVTVSFGGKAALMAEIKNSNTISVQLPVGTPGKVDVTVAFDDGRTQTLPGAFEYSDPMKSGGGWGTYGEKPKEAPEASPAPGK